MKTESKIILLLLFLSPALGELLSGSSPPLEFFTPFGIITLVSFYGGSTLLIREARARWGLQWSVIFLAIAYGILEEGVVVQSFFSINHVDLGALSGYGMIGGVQWPWTINLIVYHATISTLIPIIMVELLWPHYTYVPILRKRNLVLIGAAVGIDTVVFMNFVWSLQKNYPVPYVPSPVLLIGSCLVIGLLIWGAYRLRGSRLCFVSGRLFHPLSLAVLGFLLQAFLLLAAVLASNHVPGSSTIVIQGVVLAVVGVILVRQLLHQQREARHLVGFIIGSLVFWILLAPINEFANKMLGMSLVGVGAAVLLVYWRRIVLRTEPNNVALKEN
jgi:hypothetical protein